jgi:hypothetical protein
MRGETNMNARLSLRAVETRGSLTLSVRMPKVIESMLLREHLPACG